MNPRKRVSLAIAGILMLAVVLGAYGQTNPVTLTYLIQENLNSSAPTYASGQLPVLQAMEKATGIKVKFETVISDDFESVVQTRLAAGASLPDIVNIPNPIPYLRQNLIAPLDDLIARSAPEIQKLFASDPALKASSIGTDGKIYCVPTIGRGRNAVHAKILWIRDDWLQKLGLKAPASMDDWYTVLKAFQTRDPNGNGKADEVPMVSPTDSEYGPRSFASAFNIAKQYGNGYSVDASGKVRFDYITTDAREYFTFMNRLFTEKLYVMVDGNERNLRLTNDTLGSMEGWPDVMGGKTKQLRSQSAPNGRYVPAIAPASKVGGGYYLNPGPTYGYDASAFILQASKNKEAAIKWLNFQFSAQGDLLNNYGIEGTTYTMVGGKPVLTDFVLNNKDGMGPDEAEQMVGGKPNWPIRNITDFDVQVKMADQFVAPSIDIVRKYAREPSFPDVMASAQEVEILKSPGSDIDTYVSENVAKFILGQRPLSEFDTFVSEVKGMGLDKVLAVKQAQYDRYRKIVGK
jgi:putative aldouronate transport system substrate-binding protein